MNTKSIILSGTKKAFLGHNEVINKYYNDIRKYKTLTQEETTKLFNLYNNGTPKEKEFARNEIFKHNAKLAISMARKYCSRTDNLADLIQEANEGILIAIDKFRLDKESSFQKFALFHMRRQINNYKSNYSEVIRKTNRSKLDTRINTVRSKFIQTEHRVPTDEELFTLYNKENQNYPINNQRDIVSVEYVYIDNLSLPLTENEDNSEGYFEYNNKSASFNTFLTNENDEYNKEIINYLLSCLKPKEKEAISLLYGLNGDFECTTQIISEKINCTKERVRQLCKSAIEKMQEKLKEYQYAQHH